MPTMVNSTLVFWFGPGLYAPRTGDGGAVEWSLAVLVDRPAEVCWADRPSQLPIPAPMMPMRAEVAA